MRATSSLLVVSALLFDSAVAQTAAERAALSLYWDYGHSPPVYPSPQGAGTGDWASAYEQARAIVAQMTNLEKQNISIGYANPENGCVGSSPGVARLGYSGMCLQDAGNGVRGTEGVSGFPSGLHVGASWNRELAFDRASAMGAEFKAKGVNAALGPVVGPLGRIATGGRNWEGASNDPFLAGVLGAESVKGLQSKGVIATTKHFIANEQETNRQPGYAFEGLGINLGQNESVSENVGDVAMHELYLWPFQDAVRAGTGSVMCSYNRINNSYGCANSKTMNGLLKTELGFQGFVVSDWFAQHTGIAGAESGLDMVMPNSALWGNLSTAVSNGTLSQARLDDMATRIIATQIKLGNTIEDQGAGMPVNVSRPHQWSNVRTAASASTLLQGAIEGHVLVKNINNALPLRRGAQFISLFGYDAVAPTENNPPSPRWNTGLESVISNDSTGISLGAAPPPAIAANGTLWVGGGSGANTPPFIYDPFQAFTHQASLDGSWLAWDFLSQYPVVDPASDVCLVFINAFSTEGGDRPNLSDEYSDNLVNGIADQCANTMVIIHNAGIRIVDGFYSHPNVTAIIYAHLPGQMTGPALTTLMYGDQSFSGRMPYTTAKNASDYGALLYPTRPDNTSQGFTQSNFTEGVYTDYRAFEAKNITARFPFGFGLTYTTFNYSSLTAALDDPAANLTALPEHAPVESGGNPRLFDNIATVTAVVSNTGNAVAAEVAQLYIGIPNAPAKQLRGFSKDTIIPGHSATVRFPLTRRDLSVWDVVAQQWRLQTGSYKVYVGKSVAMEGIQLTGTIEIETAM